MATAVHKLQGAGGVGGADSYWIALAGTSGTDFAAESVAVDASGNVATVGRTQPSNRQAVIVVRDPDGTVVYEKNFSYSGQNVQFDCCVFDSAGNLYAAGHQNNYEFIVKINSSGSVQWQRRYTGSSVAYCKTLIVDDSDNLYMSGFASIIGYMGSISKINTSTGAVVWVNYGSTNNTFSYYSTNAAVDSSSNMIYTLHHRDVGSDYSTLIYKYNTSGVFQAGSQIDFQSGNSYEEADGICLDPSSNLIIINYNNSYGYLTKLPNTLSGGPITWSKTLLVGSSRLIPRGVATDSVGNIYICGIVAGTQFEGVIAKFNSSGAIQWTNTIGDGTNFTDLYKIVVQDDNTLIVSGYTQADGAGGYDGITMKIPSDGTGTGAYGSLTYQSVTATVGTASPTVSSPSRSEVTGSNSDTNAGTTVGSWTYTEELLPITI